MSGPYMLIAPAGSDVKHAADCIDVMLCTNANPLMLGMMIAFVLHALPNRVDDYTGTRIAEGMRFGRLLFKLLYYKAR